MDILDFVLIAMFSFFMVKVWTVIQGLLGTQEFEVNDNILLNGGTVRKKEVGFKDLISQVNNNSKKIVSLKQIKNKAIINFSKNKTSFKGGIAFKTSTKINVKKIKNVLLQIMQEHTQILNSPKPYVSTVELRNENIVFHLYFYSHDFKSIEDIGSDLKNEILDAFTERNITHFFRKSDSLVKVKEGISNN